MIFSIHIKHIKHINIKYNKYNTKFTPTNKAKIFL